MPDYKVGLGNVGSYQVSGKPWVSSSLVVPANSDQPYKVDFVYVTRDIYVRNDGAESIRLGFSVNGIKNSENYIVLASSSSFSGKYKVNQLYLLSHTSNPGEATVFAGLTGINGSELKNSDGSTNWSGSAGIG